MSSILEDTKHQLGLLPSDTAFDRDIILKINMALATLTQLGVGPVQGYQITDDANQWEEFTGGDPRLNAVMSYVYLKVKREFDPPPSGYATQSMDRQIQEMEYRINVVVDYG